MALNSELNLARRSGRKPKLKPLFSYSEHANCFSVGCMNKPNVSRIWTNTGIHGNLLLVNTNNILMTPTCRSLQKNTSKQLCLLHFTKIFQVYFYSNLSVRSRIAKIFLVTSVKKITSGVFIFPRPSCIIKLSIILD